MKLSATAGITFIGDFSICMKVKTMGYYKGPCHGNNLVSKGTGYSPNGIYMTFDDNYYTGGQNCSNTVVDTLHQNFYIMKVAGNSAYYTTYNVSTSPYATYNVWRCIVMTQSGDTLSTYIDGMRVNAVYCPPSTFANTEDLFFGKQNDFNAPNYYNGVMDEVRFYNRGLSAGEISMYCEYEPTLGLPEASSKSAFPELYPNPATDRLTVRIADGQDATYRIVGVDARVAQTGTLRSGENTLQIAPLASGVYFLHLQQGNDTQVVRFVKD